MERTLAIKNLSVLDTEIDLERIVKIPLTRGFVTVVDIEDQDLLRYKWRTHIDKKCNSAYAVREIVDVSKISRRSTLRLHRIILERKLKRSLTKQEYVDHVNLNGLDNRRCNLRVATKSQNMMNTSLRKDNTSGYKGVTFHQASGLWHTVIHCQGRRISLGYYKTKEEAALIYSAESKRLFGEFARS